MMLETRRVEVVPGLRQHELTRARWNVLDADRAKGFMMAWQHTIHPYPMGFCYITSMSMQGCLVVVRARSSGIHNRLSYTTAHCVDHGDDRDNFVDVFLKNSAEDMGGDYAELTNYLAEKSSLWLFESFIDGKPDSCWKDNSIAWRALWGRLIEAYDRPVADLPPEVQEHAQTRLQSFAVEGQIILDR